MEWKNREVKEESKPSFQEIESLLSEAEQETSAWIEDPGPLLQKLLSFPPGKREDFFLSLLRKEKGPLFSLLGTLMGKEEKADIALASSLGRWGSPKSVSWLQRLAGATPAKAVHKAIRKAIFRLKSLGLEVPEIAHPSPAVYHPPRPSPPEGFVSSIDAVGTRMVWMIRPAPAQGSMGFQAFINDLRGIIEFVGYETSRKKFHEYLAEWREKVSGEIVDADPEYCHGLIVEASMIQREKGQAPPGEFLKWEPWIGPPPELPLRPLIYRYVKEEEAKARTDLLDRSASLFELFPFQTWFLEEEEVKKYLPPLKEAAWTRLVLTPYQKEARLMDIYRQAAGELFDRGRRALYRRRLEEMAYILWKKGRSNEARMSLAAALNLEAEGGMLYLHPFLRELIRRSLTPLLEEEARKEERGGDLIIRP